MNGNFESETIDLTGFFNNSHRQWEIPCKPCVNCSKKNGNDSSLELMLRLSITYKLRIEQDRFDLLYNKYPDITFNLSHQETISLANITNETELVGHYLSKKFIIGVGFNLSSLLEIRDTQTLFAIPILKDGKMWQLLMQNIFQKKILPSIDRQVWLDFTPSQLKCLFCQDYPRDLYPGNFVVNQSILFMKSFIWVDKRKIHFKPSRKNDEKNQMFIMYNGSTIISWPFLNKYFNRKTVQEEVTTLNNMAIYSMGDIFISFISILILRLLKAQSQNSIIKQLRPFYKQMNSGVSFYSMNIQVSDLMHMYKTCKRKKRYEITDNNTIKLKRDATTNVEEPEDILVNMIKGERPLDDSKLTAIIIKWLHFSRGLLTESSIIANISHMIKRGEVDMAISQTSILDKDYVVIKNKPQAQNQDVPSIIGTNNRLDVHRIGRFTRNAPTNSYYNICGIACSLQKVLTKDSKTTKPKYIAKDEIGFIDLITTADTPKNSGLILESVIDCFLSTESLTTNNMHAMLLQLFPSCQVVSNPECITSLDENYIYICANQVLYSFNPNIIPKTLTSQQLDYLRGENASYFRMAQYALKVIVPFIELIEQAPHKLWICTSMSRNIYKLYIDGLFYSPKELFYKTTHIPPPNIFGPSIRITPFPTNCHLPRVGHAAYTSKNFIGISSNSLSIGELHQKSQSVAFYSKKSYPTELIESPGWFPKILVAGGWNNQEDGIAVRKGAIEMGKFSSVSYETATIKLIYGNNKYIPSSSYITFVPLIKKSDILRMGLPIGLFKLGRNDVEESENYYKETISLNVEIFSPELTVKAINVMRNGGEKEITLENERKLTFFYRDMENWRIVIIWNSTLNTEKGDLMSLNEYRCEKLRCDDISNAGHFKIYLFYAMLFIPSIGDKLQTTTTNKGVITDIIADENMPYILDPITKKNILPDLIVNPFYLKRQTLDNVLMTGYTLSDNAKNPFLNNTFLFTIKDALNYITIGNQYATGILMNPVTGLPYIKPVIVANENKELFDYQYREHIDEDGFIYMSKNTQPTHHEFVRGSIYTTRYFIVNNHKASAMMQSSHPDEIKRTEFSGAPIRGKRGGFATGLQEQMTFSGIGASRFNTEISQIRSETCTIPIYNKKGEREMILSSNTFRRTIDELIQSNIDVGLNVMQHKKFKFGGLIKEKK